LRDILSLFERPKDPLRFKAVKIGLASPEKIRDWSYGEVKKPETINYRTFKPERDGLFCARIFGPVKDYECNCGKYKRMKHRGIICEKCGVEVISSKVRRFRMGHIELATPVAHIWFFKNQPCRIGVLLGMTMKEVERVLYYDGYAVLDPGTTPLKYGQILSEEQYEKAVDQYGYSFRAEMGAPAFKEMLQNINLEEMAFSLRKQLSETRSETKQKSIVSKLKIVEAFITSGNKPEWMILDVIPVIPPDLRPLVPLEGGRFATSDLNDLYRRVINRNNRLKRLISLNAPGIIINNEKRMLQEAVDALFDNTKRERPILGSNKKPLKSLSEIIKGKQGRFRQNLLGKRVDYSGRSVIVVGPDLKLHQCGLPKAMALELFKPFIFNRLIDKGIVQSIKSAKKYVELKKPEVWDALEEVIREHPVMLNRAPTLHRLGIQAFEPVLSEGKAIRLHPLVCTAYNADFDGDQMAVHVPLSYEAQLEARTLMMATNNVMLPANGKPVIVPTQDIVLGLYFLTSPKEFAKGEGLIFGSMEEAILAYEMEQVDVQARVKIRIDNKIYDTVMGRILVYEITPKEISFDDINQTLKKKSLAKLIDLSYRIAGDKKTVIFADNLKNLGYKFATKAGISISIENLEVPPSKKDILEKTINEVQKIENEYREGAITQGERYNKIVDIWQQATDEVAKSMMKHISTKEYVSKDGKAKREGNSFNPIFIMADSGARGSENQLKQLAGMRGLMAKPSGEIIETPIVANFREGLNVLQYFISTHGARKGLADTALKTANAGYLTRRLVDVAQDSFVVEEDCGTLDGIEVESLIKSGEVIERVGQRVLGRTALYDIIDPHNNEVIVKANEMINEEAAKKIDERGINKVFIRSVLTCKTARGGVCRLCYGRDLARGLLVEIGEPIGIIAAQSIGEPGTQLTMRTFHIGGTASATTEESVLRARKDGTVKYKDLHFVLNDKGQMVVMNRHAQLIILDEVGREVEKTPLVYGARLFYQEGDKVKKGDILAEWDPFTVPIITEVSGRIKFGDLIEGVTIQEQVDEVTKLATKKVIDFKDITLRPRISIKDESGKTAKLSDGKSLARYMLPVNAVINVQEGDFVSAGSVIAKIPRETTKTKDITGGLPRVEELFEARMPKDFAVITEIEGKVSFGKMTKGKRRVIITPTVGEPKEYLIPKGKHIIVREGEYVNAGEPLVDGPLNPHDILKVKGMKELAKYLVNEVQEVYRLQGVDINDKHIEVIVRQMLRKVIIKDAGDTTFLKGDLVERVVFEQENDRVISEGKRPATAEVILLGITKASLNTESFISAASFQETTKVLTAAAIEGKVDNLYGLKENIIMGRLIPVGTGVRKYNRIRVKLEEPEENNSIESA
jgi:DNA-directed RNA polymerase subunit beta'